MKFSLLKFRFFSSNLRNPITEKSTYCDDTKLIYQNNWTFHFFPSVKIMFLKKSIFLAVKCIFDFNFINLKINLFYIKLPMDFLSMFLLFSNLTNPITEKSTCCFDTKLIYQNNWKCTSLFPMKIMS